ncbi:MAG: glycine cleavage system protein GcvH [Planctomycetota bacterium]|jgi:glycine cleavage system H protein
MLIDADARYLESHEWVKAVDGGFTVGLSGYAIEQLGDIVYMELPEVGASFAKGDAFGVVESVKSAADMYMPIGGKVLAVNTEIPDAPDTLKTDAYNAGWLIKIDAADATELETLMDEAAYRKFLETEA